MPSELGQYECLDRVGPLFEKAFPVHSSYTFTGESAVFDEPNLLSAAGLVPVLELAEQTGLSNLIDEHVDLPSTRVKSGAVNPAGKLTSIIAAMMCGADSIDDANVLRAGGTPRVFDEVYAPSTLGIFLREFTFGHANQLAAVARGHLVALAQRTPLLPGIDQRAFVDIDSLLRPVYGPAKQGASFGHAKIAGRALLRLGLSPQITTISTATSAPVIAEARLRSGKAGSGRAAATQIKQAITTTRRCGAGKIMLRGDSSFGTKKVIGACVDEGIEFSLSVSRNTRITTAIGAIDEHAWTPVHYPGAVTDPDTGQLISDAEVAETPYTLRLGSSRTITARLVVRRVRDARYPDGLFPVWRYHPFLTNSDLLTAEADITHRKHAIIETTFADLIDGPLAHIPSGLFAANCAWLACAVITHNLLRAAGTIAGGDTAVARGATLRRNLVNIPARFAAPARKPLLHLPVHWPWQAGWKTLWHNIIGYPTAQPRAA
jgi:Transposase DDE domain group 1